MTNRALYQLPGTGAEGRRYLGLDVLTRSQAVATADEEVTDELTLPAITA